jgi:hypothetical protein
VIVTELDTPDFTVIHEGERPAGVHVSDVLGDMVRRLYPARYDKRDRSGKRIPMDAAKIQAGLDFEYNLERLLVRAHVVPGLFRPDPIQKDGIWGSPDGIDPNLFGPVEYKLTWYSSKKTCPTDDVYWPWVMQMAAYCYLTDSTKAILWAQHVNGNYAPPKPGPPRKYRLEFTPFEIEENWGALWNHAKALGWL